MRLFGKRDDDSPIRFNRFFSVNDAVRLEVGGQYHASRVEDIEGDTLWIAEPASHGVPVRLIEGKPVVLISSIETGMRGYRSRFIGQRPGPPAMLKLEPYEPLGRVQRRGFARVLDSLPVVFTVMSSKSKMLGVRVETRARNVSGGGLGLYVQRTQRPMVTDVVDVELFLPSGPVRAAAQVVWVGDTPGAAEIFEIAVRFTSIGEADRQRIIRRVFAREAELHKVGLL